MKDLAADDAVEYAEPDFTMFAQERPQSRLFEEQWGFHSGPGGGRFQQAWNMTKGIDTEVVAVIDTGVLPHANLKGKLLPGYDLISNPIRAGHNRARNADATDPGTWLTLAEVSDPDSVLYRCHLDVNLDPEAIDSSWHGTHVAGTIGASPNYVPGVVGRAWDGAILPVRVLGKCGAGDSSDAIDGIRWSAGLHVEGVPDNPHPAKVLNLRFGGDTFAYAFHQCDADPCANTRCPEAIGFIPLAGIAL